MPSISAEQITILQQNTNAVRNICILAHVDHGKTTLSDSLLVSNGIISSKLSGKIRYLDSRPDEQERGITMKSSAISLFFTLMSKGADDAASSSDTTRKRQFLINLIDSPGHVDFSSEVSTASRLCDGGLVLVDVVEGVCTQTHTVLRQAWQERVKPILVLNKIDRLIMELKLSPLEAFHHLTRVLEQVNAVMGTFYSEDLMKDDAARYDAFKQQRQAATGNQQDEDGDDFEWELKHGDDSRLYFAPDAGNVIFASAIHGWAFRLDSFARLYADKLNMKETVLNKCLWGEFYLDTKTKRVGGSKGLKGRSLKPMFVQFILENLWNVYDTILESGNHEKIEKIIKTLQLKVLPREIKSKDVKNLLQVVMSQWLPLPAAVLLAVVEQIPSPLEAQPIRLPYIFHPKAEVASELPEEKTELEKAVYSCCKSRNVPMVAFISKMFSVTPDMLVSGNRKQLSLDEMRERRRLAIAAKNRMMALEGETKEETDGASVSLLNADGSLMDSSAPSSSDEKPNNHFLVGFARIYSGTIKVGDEIRVMGPKFNHRHPDEHVTTTKVTKLYLIMGRELQELDEVPAGNVFGIGGLENIVLKAATICSIEGAELCPSLASTNTELSAPIVRVAVEPEDPSEMDKLIKGLDMLNKADPCVQVALQDTGEHVIMCAGELHLERCLKDLREEFAKIAIHVSPPIVPFKETITNNPAINSNEQAIENTSENGPKLPLGTVKMTAPNKLFTIQIRCQPLPSNVTSLIEEKEKEVTAWAKKDKRLSKRAVRSIREDASVSGDDADVSSDDDVQTPSDRSNNVPENKNAAFTEISELLNSPHKICSFGPRRVGANILVNAIDDISSLSEGIRRLSVGSKDDDYVRADSIPTWKTFENSIDSGFQIATGAGPLCNEPMYGVMYTLENFEIDKDAWIAATALQRGSVSGQLISMVKDACLQGFLQYSPRLMLAMYSCDLQAPGDVLGKVYSVLSRRKGRIISEEMREGTPFFNIKSLIPVVESFGFADDIRKRTSGAASPQLIFNRYEILDLDPFWIPTTEEELEDLGEKADRENIAKRYMDAVRKRKGLFVEKKIVEFAEKQKTLKNK